MSAPDKQEQAGCGVRCSAWLAGWTDQQCRQLLEELLAEEKVRCCKIKLLTPDVAGPCDAALSRYAGHDQQRFSSSRVALAWLDDKWAMYVQGMKPANILLGEPNPTSHPKAMSQPTPSNEAEREAGFAGAHGSADAPDFISELRNLINKHSMENASNTPDFILAQYLTNCLRAWNQATQQRETWHGRDTRRPSAQPPTHRPATTPNP